MGPLPDDAVRGRRAAESSRKQRVGAFDGLRGLAIVLVMLGHAGNQLWPTSGGVFDIPYLRGLFGGGAVVVFFVVGGFIVAHVLLRELDRGVMDPIRFYLRRLVRLGVQLLLLSLALVGVQVLDTTAPGSMKGLVQNLAHMLTYTLNLLPSEREVPVRAEVGHLWYLSVQQQVYLLLPLLLLVVWRRRLPGAALLIVAIVLVYWHRQQILETGDWISATIDTFARSDGLLWGFVLALLLPWLQRFRGWGVVLALSCLGCLGFQLILQEMAPFSYLGPWSLGYQFLIGVVVVAIWCLPRQTVTSRLLAFPLFAWLGRNSLTLFLWHLPVFIVISRHTDTWSPVGRTVVAGLMLICITLVMEHWVERPTRRLLATHEVFRASHVSRAGLSP